MAAEKLSNELKQKIKDIDSSKKKIENNIKQSKEKVKTQLRESIFLVMDNEDFKNNVEYSAFYDNYSTPSGGTKPTKKPTKDDKTVKEKWIKSLSKEQQIALLAEYSIDAEIEKGENPYEKDLKEAQRNKEIIKKAMAIEAKKVIAAYENLMVEHRKILEELNKKIEDLNNKISAKTSEITRRKGAPLSPEALAIINADIARLTTDKSGLETKLTELEKQTSVYEKSIKKQISKFEEMLRENGIYVGIYEGLNEPSQNRSSNEQTSSSPAKSNAKDDRKPSQIAKAMMVDFDNLAPSDINEMIEHSGYKDLLDMSRNLGPINRHKLRTQMENMIEDREKDILINKDIIGATADLKITVEDLKNLREIDETKFDAIVKQIQHYVKNYDTMKVHERKKADEIMEYIKISVLLTESHTSFVGRFARKLRKDSKRIENLGAELNKFSKRKGAREDKKWQKNKSLREMLKVKTPIPQQSHKSYFDRTGENSIKKDDYTL